MIHWTPARPPGWLLPLLLPLMIGCSGRDRGIGGIVTYEGAAVDIGFITFCPVDDPSATRGGEIIQGKYQVTGLTPGRKRVLITSAPNVQKIADRNGVYRAQVLSSAKGIPPTSVGNNQIVEVAAGQYTLDIDLKRPPR